MVGSGEVGRVMVVIVVGAMLRLSDDVGVARTFDI